MTQRQDRPLSPHIGIYRWQWTMLFSILHRASGIGLSAGMIYLVIWLLALQFPQIYIYFFDFHTSIVGVIILVGFSGAIFFHMFNGIRHLIWDTGAALELGPAERGAFFVGIATVLATAALWFFALA